MPNGKSAYDVIKDDAWLKYTFVPLIQQRGAAVIKARGASSAASAANGIIQSVYNLVTDTKPGESFSVSHCSTGEYGVDEGLMFSFPSRTEKGVVKVVNGVKLNEYSQIMFNKTLDELRGERDTVKSLGLLD